jgi:hypothetical protein
MIPSIFPSFHPSVRLFYGLYFLPASYLVPASFQQGILL